jgi:hypothetical protein
MRSPFSIIAGLFVCVLLALPTTAQPATDSAAAVGVELAKSLNTQDVEGMLAMIDVDSMARALTADLKLSGADAKGFQDGLRRGLRKNLETGMQQFALKQGHAKFIRTGSRDGNRFTLVRIEYNDDNGGFDYIEYYLSPEQKIRDWYTHSRANLASNSIRLAMSAMMNNESLLTALFGVKSISARDVKNFREFNGYLAAGDMSKAYRALERLPEAYRKTRDWAMLRVAVAGFDEREYRVALARWPPTLGATRAFNSC